MTNIITFAWKGLIGLALGGIIVAALLRSSPAQQPSLIITSPSNNAVFTAGQTVTVTVQTTGAFQEVTIFAQQPLSTDQVAMSPPYQFSVSIPGTTSPGPYSITAFGAITPGNGVKSPSVTIRVENANPVVSLKADLSQVTFGFVGDQIPVLVTGTFSDGTSADLSKSQGTSYTSNNTGVVVIGTNGLAAATGAGNADIIIRYGSLSVDVPVSVPQTIRGDLNGDGKVDLDDLNVLNAALNTPATKPTDARDLNGDGVINALDARILVTLCTRPACATH